MAFTKENLSAIEDGKIGALNAAKLWVYKVPTGDTITSAYFANAGEVTMKTGDIVLAVSATEYGFFILGASLAATQLTEIGATVSA